MSITMKMTGWIALAGLFAAVTLASSSAYAVISAPGDPAFAHSFKLRANKGKWIITAKDGFDFIMGGMSYPGTKSNYKITATFDNSGNLIDGNLVMKGSLPAFGLDANNTVLLTADLDDFGFFGATTAAFGTTNLAGEICVVVGCTLGESVWLEFDNPLTGGVNDMLKATGFMVTTIPLPAAVWLFGSGLIAVGTIARRRKIKSVA